MTYTHEAKQAEAMRELIEPMNLRDECPDVNDIDEIGVLEPMDVRDVQIARIAAEMYCKRKAALSSDDMQAALESCDKSWATYLAEAIKAGSPYSAFTFLNGLVVKYLSDDCEIEAIKWMEKMEQERH